MWPPQILGTIGAIAGKLAGGDRVLGLLPTTVRIWSRMRSGVVDSWTQQLEDHWDTALRGSSALRAAPLRATLDETGQAMGIARAELFADMEQFYDSLDLGWLINAGIRLESPPTVMALE
eukprot:1411356-Pyramimonas_sp.AAC.1